MADLDSSEPQSVSVDTILALPTATGVFPDATDEALSVPSIPPSSVVAGRRAYWQLTFATAECWRGTFTTEAPDMRSALTVATLLGCNPGGEVAGLGFRARAVHPDWLDRLITSKEEVWTMPEPVDVGPLEDVG